MITRSPNSLARNVPMLGWIRSYQSSWLRDDLIAGITVWALVVPQAIAYAQIAGMPPQAGVFASFAAPLGYAIFGTSRQLIVSPTSATAAISASMVAPLVVADDMGEYVALSAALAILCGLVFLLLGRLKLGFLSQFIPPAVQTGFLIGLGLTIMVGQLCKVLGVPSGEGPFYRQFWDLLTELGDTHLLSTLLGGVTLVCLIAASRYAPQMPAALILVVASIVVVSIFGLADEGVSVVGQVDRAFPMPAVPRVSFHDLVVLVPGTFAIVVIGYSESMSVVRRFADEHHYEVDANQELIALGIASMAGGLFQGFNTAGGASQSAANDRAGARTQVSALVLSVLAALSAILLMPLFKNLPLAVLGAIVINAVAGFIDVEALKRVYRLRRDSFILAVLALVGVLVLGILQGLLLTSAISVLLLLGYLARPRGERLDHISRAAGFALVPEKGSPTRATQLTAFRPTTPVLYLNETWVRGEFNAFLAGLPNQPSVVALDLEASAELDVSGVDMLQAIRRDLNERGMHLWIINASANVMDLLRRSELHDMIESQQVFASGAAAQQHLESQEGEGASGGRFTD